MALKLALLYDISRLKRRQFSGFQCPAHWDRAKLCGWDAVIGDYVQNDAHFASVWDIEVSDQMYNAPM
jgi:hypothetical protein